MIGDGVNDAAALQQSDLSISLQSGNKIAISSSQIILMKNQLKVIPQLFQLSNLSQRIIRSNLFWAFLYNGMGIPVAMGLFSHLGFTLNPMWAGAAMTFSSISVVLNSLRIKLYKI
jgi:Cu2+-exporting ATPase